MDKLKHNWSYDNRTDIKQLMSNATVRDDLRFLLRKGVEEITKKVKGEA